MRFWSNEKKTTTQIFIFFNTNLTKLSTMKIFNKMTHTCCSSSYRFHSIKKVLSNKKNNSTVKSFYWIFVLVLYQSLSLDWLIDGLNRNLNGSIMVRGEIGASNKTNTKKKSNKVKSHLNLSLSLYLTVRLWWVFFCFINEKGKTTANNDKHS